MGPITAIARMAAGEGIGRFKAIMTPINASAPSVVRAQATVMGPYPRKAMETTINVPPQIKPSAMTDIQLPSVGGLSAMYLIHWGDNSLYALEVSQSSDNLTLGLP